MEYSTFLKLVRDGEKATVDFKIQLDAFMRGEVVARAELAKDICAFSNNGNVTSYIIVGVSDDGKSFRSVANKKLTDDNLQDFCKKAIFPPPKVKLHRRKWKRTQPIHREIEFVIIQVGPQPRQVFRFAQDFIDYKKGICYRRNEVWIRRNTTSDLATPEEIKRLASGQSLLEDIQKTEKQAERDLFAHASQDEKINLITAETKLCYKKAGYIQLPPREWSRFYPTLYWVTNTLAYKKIGSTIILICSLTCARSVTGEDLWRLYSFGCFDKNFVKWCDLPRYITNLTRRKIRSVRIIWLMPVIGRVSTDRITKIFPQSRRLGTFLHFYHPFLHSRIYMHTDKPLLIPSSSELLILDTIKSTADYTAEFLEAISVAESDKTTIVTLEQLENTPT